MYYGPSEKVLWAFLQKSQLPIFNILIFFVEDSYFISWFYKYACFIRCFIRVTFYRFQRLKIYSRLMRSKLQRSSLFAQLFICVEFLNNSLSWIQILLPVGVNQGIFIKLIHFLRFFSIAQKFHVNLRANVTGSVS